MEQLDWLDEVRNIKWAIASLLHLFSRGSNEREIMANAVRGIEARLEWIISQAQAERAHAKAKGANL